MAEIIHWYDFTAKKNAKNNVGKYILTLMINAVFRKTMENVIKQWNVNLITTEAKNNTWYHTSKISNDFYQQKSKEHRCPRIYRST